MGGVAMMKTASECFNTVPFLRSSFCEVHYDIIHISSLMHCNFFSLLFLVSLIILWKAWCFEIAHMLLASFERGVNVMNLSDPMTGRG